LKLFESRILHHFVTYILHLQTYLVPFLRYWTLKNITTSKSKLRVTRER